VACIPLQCIVDDETFMNQMNVGSSFSQVHVEQEIAEEEFDVDEEEEGLIGARQGDRTANYAICVCLLNYVVNLKYVWLFYY
jgi:hypothetical protein